MEDKFESRDKLNALEEMATQALLIELYNAKKSGGV